LPIGKWSCERRERAICDGGAALGGIAGEPQFLVESQVTDCSKVKTVTSVILLTRSGTLMLRSLGQIMNTKPDHDGPGGGSWFGVQNDGR
jgi:hypothetical protein